MQRDIGYIHALDQIMAPFNKPPADATDYTGAARRLRTAVRQLESLTPPVAFAAGQAHLVMGLREQAALAPRMGRAFRAHDAVTLSNLESKVISAEGSIHAANSEMRSAYFRCRAGKFKTC